MAIWRRSGPAGRRLEDSTPHFSDLACPQGAVERRAEAAQEQSILPKPLELQAVALAGELGGRPEGLLLFDRLVIQRCEQAAAPDLRGIIPGIWKESPDIPLTRPVQRAIPRAAVDGGGDRLPERASLPEALEGGEPLVPRGLRGGPDRRLFLRREDLLLGALRI
ncbi:MAG: hypothetical protein DMF53_00040 [Acidobacteria bacterium]|nr:MAG: hypothetical protein DMF53_00040 [Acidobacteriota bacterium]